MKILLFFSYKTSLKTWEEKGYLQRELQFWSRMAEIYKIGFLSYGFLTYGDILDLLRNYFIFLHPIENRGKITLLNSFLIPFRFKFIKDYDVYKTQQMLGSWVAVIAKLLYRKKLIVRCGFELFRQMLRRIRLLKEYKMILYIVPVYLMEFLAYHTADKIILTTEDMKRFVCKTFFIKPQKIKVIPNWINKEEFK